MTINNKNVRIIAIVTFASGLIFTLNHLAYAEDLIPFQGINRCWTTEYKGRPRHHKSTTYCFQNNGLMDSYQFDGDDAVNSELKWTFDGKYLIFDDDLEYESKNKIRCSYKIGTDELTIRGCFAEGIYRFDNKMTTSVFGIR